MTDPARNMSGDWHREVLNGEGGTEAGLDALVHAVLKKAAR